ncbi:MAG: hypothetical protein UW73_C0012G0028 [Microgenomates group bacterium GW2011_GWB1_44_8]|nr:MAG: hypothetical protein UW73_C0012G0028 [Microgenomates group bacterium GW2011_GWB1_44_8]
MKFLLINPPSMGRYWKPATPHVGLGYLAEILLVNKHKVEMADMRLGMSFEQLVSQIKRFRPDYIGITAASLEYQKVYDFIAEIKKLFNISVILGGPHASLVKEQVLQYSQTDLVVVGEGEKTLLEIAQGRPFRKINGLIWRSKKDGIVTNPPREHIFNLNQLPFPKYKKFALDQYLEHKIALLGERGCPYACSYCASRLILGRGYRRRSPENILKEIRYWHRRGYRSFGFNDDGFTGIKPWAMEICDLIIKANLNSTFELRTGIRVDTADEELIIKMKQAGFFFFAFGAESADQQVLDLIGKKITPSLVKKTVKLVNKHGLESSGFFMIGLPGDTPEKFRKTLKFARGLNLNEVRIYNAIPYPGTELYDWVLKHGRLLYTPEYYLNKYERLERDPVFETDVFPADERRKAFDLGEQFFAELLYIKTVGNTLAKPLIFISSNNTIRHLLIKVGFRLTPWVRKLQRLRRHRSYFSMLKEDKKS